MRVFVYPRRYKNIPSEVQKYTLGGTKINARRYRNIPPDGCTNRRPDAQCSNMVALCFGSGVGFRVVPGLGLGLFFLEPVHLSIHLLQKWPPALRTKKMNVYNETTTRMHHFPEPVFFSIFASIFFPFPFIITRLNFVSFFTMFT